MDGFGGKDQGREKKRDGEEKRELKGLKRRQRTQNESM